MFLIVTFDRRLERIVGGGAEWVLLLIIKKLNNVI